MESWASSAAFAYNDRVDVLHFARYAQAAFQDYGRAELSGAPAAAAAAQSSVRSKGHGEAGFARVAAAAARPWLSATELLLHDFAGKVAAAGSSVGGGSGGGSSNSGGGGGVAGGAGGAGSAADGADNGDAEGDDVARFEAAKAAAEVARRCAVMQLLCRELGMLCPDDREVQQQQQQQLRRRASSPTTTTATTTTDSNRPMALVWHVPLTPVAAMLDDMLRPDLGCEPGPECPSLMSSAYCLAMRSEINPATGLPFIISTSSRTLFTKAGAAAAAASAAAAAAAASSPRGGARGARSASAAAAADDESSPNRLPQATETPCIPHRDLARSIDANERVRCVVGWSWWCVCVCVGGGSLTRGDGMCVCLLGEPVVSSRPVRPGVLLPSLILSRRAPLFLSFVRLSLAH